MLIPPLNMGVFSLKTRKLWHTLRSTCPGPQVTSTSMSNALVLLLDSSRLVVPEGAARTIRLDL